MSFRIFLHPKAVRALQKLDRRVGPEIKNKLKELENLPESGKKLKYSDFWSIRVGDYRAIYEIDQGEKKAIVLFIGHRKNVYDDFLKLF